MFIYKNTRNENCRNFSSLEICKNDNFGEESAMINEDVYPAMAVTCPGTLHIILKPLEDNVVNFRSHTNP